MQLRSLHELYLDKANAILKKKRETPEPPVISHKASGAGRGKWKSAFRSEPKLGHELATENSDLDSIVDEFREPLVFSFKFYASPSETQEDIKAELSQHLEDLNLNVLSLDISEKFKTPRGQRWEVMLTISTPNDSMQSYYRLRDTLISIFSRYWVIAAHSRFGDVW